MADSDVEYLAKDQTKVESFTITLLTARRRADQPADRPSPSPAPTTIRVVSATDVTGAVTEAGRPRLAT